MQIVFCITMFVFGACLGSFLCCQARRLRLKETNHKKLGPRSVCLHCKHQLKWYENLPIISWFIQKGRCRHCHQKIGLAEILSELGVGFAFLSVSIFFVNSFIPPNSILFSVGINTLNWSIFITTLLLAVSLCFLAIYDGLYGELPSFCLGISALLAAIVTVLKICNICSTTGFDYLLIIDVLFAVAILGGIYLILYLISKGKWVGDGDWILGSIIAMALGTPWLAIITLFVANFTASVVSYPLIKKKKSHKIFFGPYLVFAFFVALIISTYGIINLW